MQVNTQRRNFNYFPGELHKSFNNVLLSGLSIYGTSWIKMRTTEFRSHYPRLFLHKAITATIF